MLPQSPILIVHYSRSGTTARAAHALAQRLDADEWAIEDLRDAQGSGGVLRALRDRLLGTLPPIAAPTMPLERYDLVVLATPVWGGRAAAPMRRFLHDYGNRLDEVAFLCTLGGSGAPSTFRDMQARLGRTPRATCALTAAMFDDGRDLPALDSFAEQLAAVSHPLPHVPPHEVRHAPH